MMEKWKVVVTLMLVALPSFFSYSPELGLEQLSIDCGATSERRPQPNVWQMDDGFIKSGQNNNVATNIIPLEMNTLRYFPHDHKNCYNLPLLSSNKYLLRAGFYYGNYDGLDRAPMFYLEINGQFWTTVFTREPLYVEMIYPNKRNNLQLCLVRWGKDDVPFISSLEATVIPDNFYRLTDNHTIFNLHSRTHFGVRQDIGEPSDGEDVYNRIWKVNEFPIYQQIQDVISSTIQPTSPSTLENRPPYAVLAGAITPQNSSGSITMLVDFPKYTSLAYFVFYFNEPDQWPPVNRTRKIQIYIDQHEMATVDVPQNGTGQVVSLYPVAVENTAIVTLAPAEGSNFPPIINAIEVFTPREVSRCGRSHYYSSMVLVVLHVFAILILVG